VRRSDPRAFTLVELLATTALAAVVMAALMQVIAGLDRSEGLSSAGPETGELWRMNLVETLRHDIALTRRVTVIDGALVLEGPLGLDPVTLQRDHLPVRVRYSVVGTDGDPDVVESDVPGGVVREQMDLLDRSNRPSVRTLLAVGVRGFEVAMVPEPEAEDGGAEPETPVTGIRVRIQFVDPSDAPIQEVFAVEGG